MEETVQIDGAQCSALGEGELQIRVIGRWMGRGRAPVARAMLVVEHDGRRHRFPALPQPRRSRLLSGAADWSAAFTVPAWVGSQLEDNSSLRVGDLSLKLPPGLFRSATSALTDEVAMGEAPSVTGETPVGSADLLRAVPLQAEPVRQPETAAGPSPSGADDGLASMIDALRVELEQRAASEARLRVELSAARAELQERADPIEEVEATHRELRRELDALAEAVGQRELLESRVLELAAQSADLQRELSRLRSVLSTSEVAREAALSEASALRSELDRLAAQLAQARRPNGEHPGLSEARALLSEARALRERISTQT